ncbi:MAG TPA: alpha-galactosidase [Mycobacteriales bacterium]|nr:alpha-galactosidase [Mycobacteriales bacterium]
MQSGRLVRIAVATAVLAPMATAAAVGAAVDRGAAAAPAPFSRGGVTATVTATSASLGNGLIRRGWVIGADGSVDTTALVDADAHNWVVAAPDFSIDVDGVSTGPGTGWQLEQVTPMPPPAQPDRPGSGTGAALRFRYALAEPGLPTLELQRLVVLHPGSSVIETTSTLQSLGPPARVSAYSLDQVRAADASLPAEVQAYNDGSDWRDDYRHVAHPTGAFDAEGEVARFGHDAGFFLVSQRRGGSMSRAGRDSDGRSWVGVDWARDLFDYGPLQTDPPSYNRLDNPAYPAPVRARVLPPLGSLDLGTSYLGVYRGGAQNAAAAFSTDFVANQQPDFARTVGLNTFHPWSHGPGMSDTNLRVQVDVAQRLGIETFMLDDQWQGGPGGESGDWQWDPQRFPDRNHDGVPDFVDYLHAHGLQLGLWMSPLEFNGSSTTYAAHPDWACAPIGDLTAQVQDDAGLGVWDATNPQFQDYLAGVVHRLVRDDDVREFKFDFMAWVDCGSSAGVHDYADYEAAFVDLVHRMQAENPGVTFELDETNDQRCWPFESAQIGPSWFDNAHLHAGTPLGKLLHDLWSAAPWVPTWSLGIGLYDGTLTGPYAGVSGVDFLFPLAMLTHITFWTDLTQLSPAQQTETAWWVDWYRAHRDALGPTVYELTTADPLDGHTWAVFEPWDGTRGYVFAFRPAGASGSVPVSLQGLDPGTHYRLTDVRTGRPVATGSGARLASGLRLTLPAASAQVLSVTPLP